MELMLWRETPTASASSCWVQPFSARRSFTRFRTAPSMTSILYRGDCKARLTGGNAPFGSVDVDEPQVEDVVGARVDLHAFPHRPHDVAVRERDERRVGVDDPHRLVEELRAPGGIELDAPP